MKSRFLRDGIAGLLGRCASACAALVFACGGAFAQASWNSIGPPGGTVSAVLVSPASVSTLIAGTPENGIFVSTDSGLTWSTDNAGLVATTDLSRQTLYVVYALATDGRYAYAATASGLFYRSLAAGSSWTAMTGTGSATPITMLAFDAGTNRLFAASNTMGSVVPGVYSTALDTTSAPPAPVWSLQALPLSAGAPAVGAIAIVALPTGGAAASLMASSGGRLFAAPILPGSQTLTWADADPSATMAGDVLTALLYSADFQQAYVCSGGTVFYSGNPLDAQPLWSVATMPPPVTGVSFVCTGFVNVGTVDGGTPQIGLGTDQGAFVTLDGATFLATASLGAGAPANGFAVAPISGMTAATVFAASGFGVSSVAALGFIGGANWAPLNGPASVTGGSNGRLNNANVVDAAVIGTQLFAAAVSMQYLEVFTSTDSGATWSATHIGTVLGPFEDIGSLAADAAHGVLFSGTSQGLLAYSTTTGAWVSVAAFTQGNVSALAAGGSFVFVGTDNGMFAVPLGATPSTAVPVAAGLTGKAVKSLLVTGGNVYAAVIDANGDSFVYVAPESAVGAGTAAWPQFGANSVGTSRVTSMALVGSNLLAATSGGLVYFASQSGSWASANTSANPAQRIADTFNIVNAIYSDGTNVYAGTGSSGVYVSPVGSTFTWTLFNGSGATALPTVEVHTLRASGTTLYAATRAGIATYSGITAVAPPAPTTSSGGGGGAIGFGFALLLLMAVAALRRAR